MSWCPFAGAVIADRYRAVAGLIYGEMSELHAVHARISESRDLHRTD